MKFQLLSSVCASNLINYLLSTENQTHLINTR